MLMNLMYNLRAGLIAIGVLLPILGGQANATHQTILVVSDSAAVGDIDSPLVALLQSLDYTVNTAGMNQAMRDSNGGPLSAANAAEIAASDLVLMTRKTSSTGYNNPFGWNSLDKPMLLMNPFLLRGGGSASQDRLGWMINDNIEPVSNTETDFIPVAGHPFTAGLSNPSAIFDWTPPATGGLDSLPIAAELLPGTSIAGTMDGRVYSLVLDLGMESPFLALRKRQLDRFSNAQIDCTKEGQLLFRGKSPHNQRLTEIAPISTGKSRKGNWTVKKKALSGAVTAGLLKTPLPIEWLGVQLEPFTVSSFLVRPVSSCRAWCQSAP